MLKFGEIYIEKRKFHSIEPTNINDVNINCILVSNKYLFNKKI